MTPLLLPLLLLAGVSRAQVSSISSAVSNSTSPSTTTSAVATASPSSTLPATALVESYNASQPQSWCPSGSYCSGDVSLLVSSQTSPSLLPPPSTHSSSFGFAPSDVASFLFSLLLTSQLLQTVELAQIFPDSKTFPDKPTKFSYNETLTAFNAAKASGNNLTGAFSFVSIRSDPKSSSRASEVVS